MNIFLPDSLHDFVEGQVAGRGHGRSSEYICELIRRDLDRQILLDRLLKGANSEPGVIADGAWLAAVRDRIRSSGSA